MSARARRGVPQAGRLTRPGPREERALLLLCWAGFLTTSQLASAAGYPSLRRAQRRLRVWLDRGFTRVELQSGALHLPSLHVPTARAREYLVEAGRLDAGHVVPRAPRPQKRAHALLARDVFVGLLAAEVRGELGIADFQFDSDLTRSEPYRSAGLIPDGVAVLEVATERKTLALEADTGSETTTTLRKKFTKWRGIVDGWTGPDLVLLAIATGDGRRRTLERLMREAGLGDVSQVVVRDELHHVVRGLAQPRDLYVRHGRTERRTSIAQDPETAGVGRGRERAFRVFEDENPDHLGGRGSVIVVRER